MKIDFLIFENVYLLIPHNYSQSYDDIVSNTQNN